MASKSNYSKTPDQLDSDGEGQIREHDPLLIENYDDSIAFVPESPTPNPDGTYELARLNTRELHDLVYLQEVVDLPQGRHLGIFAITVNFVSRIVGSGIFAVPALIYKDVGGSPAIFFLVWAIAVVLAFAGLYVYLEMGSLVAKNGGTKTFLEFIFYRPKMLTTTVVGIFYIFFGFVVSNSIVFGQYFLSSLGIDAPSDAAAGYVGLMLVAVSLIIHSFSLKGGTMIQNLLGLLKLILLVAMALAAIYVLLPERVTSIENQLKGHSFFATKKPVTPAGLTSALFKAFFAMSGWNAVHTLAGEIADPVRTLKISGPLSLAVITVCYFFINLAYLIVIPPDELMNSGELVGSLLFEKIFGVVIGRWILTLSVAFCAGGNVFVAMYSCARMNQEVFREGFLPFSKFFSSNSRFNTPVPALCIVSFISSIFLIVPSRGNLYGFVVNLEGYPSQIFVALLAFGIFILRRRYPEMRAPIRASLPLTAFLLLFSAFLLIGPFIPTKGESVIIKDGYLNYGLASCLVLSAFALYWFVMFRLLPKVYGYDLVAVEETLNDGLTIKIWEKSYK